MTQIVARRRVDGVVSYCNQAGPSGSYWTIQAAGFRAEDGITIVRGEDGLDCAVNGAVHNQECNLADYTVARLTEPTPGYLGYTFGVEAPTGGLVFQDFHQEWTPRSRRELKPRLYAIRGKPHVDLSSGRAMRPGEGRALAGFVPYSQSSGAMGQKLCRDFPVSPELAERAQEILSPSPDFCADAAVSCAGTTFDARLPLENELASDADGVESSWRYYLQKARQAADESDARALEYVNSRIDDETRAEELSLRRQVLEEKINAELETVQAACGTSVDPRTALTLYGFGESSPSSVTALVTGNNGQVQGVCTDGTPPSGFTCVSGVLLRSLDADLLKDPETLKLAKCIADFDDVSPLTQLGDSSICYWRAGGEVCAGASERAPCPQLPSDTSSCGTVRVDTDGDGQLETVQMQRLGADEGLALYSTQDVLPPKPTEGLCQKIRYARAGRTTGSTIAEFAKSYALTQDNVARVASGIDFDIEYGGYARLRVGQETYRTGTTSSGPNTTSWPCGGPRPSECDDGADGLFCDQYQCDSITGRAAANQRLFEAFLAARVMGYSTDQEAVAWTQPYYLESSLLPIETMAAGTFALDGGYQVNYEQSDNWTIFWGTSVPTYPASTVALVHTLNVGMGDPYLLGEEDEVRVGFGRTSLEGLLESHNAFFGGLAVGVSGEGALARVLAGKQSAATITYPLPFGGNFEVSSPNVLALFAGYGDQKPSREYVTPDCSCVGGPRASAQVCGTCDVGQSGINKALVPFGLKSKGRTLEVTRNTFPNPSTFQKAAQLEKNLELVSTSQLPKLDDKDALDGLELICSGAEPRDVSACDLSEPPDVRTLGDLPKLGGYLKCVGDAIVIRAALSTFQNMPVGVKESIVGGGAYYGSGGGNIAEYTSQLRQSLVQVATSGPIVGRELAAFGAEASELYSVMRSFNIEGDISSVELSANIADRLASCLTSVAGIGGGAWEGTGGRAVATAVTCANSAAQISYAKRIQGLREDALNEQRVQVLSGFKQRFIDHIAAMEAELSKLKDSSIEVSKALSRIESEKQKSRRAIERALWLGSQEAENAEVISTAIQARAETALERYLSAHRNAQRLAFLAKRAVEQRLGVRLSDMRDDLPLVEAPYTWESTVCSTSPVDFAALSSDGESFADQFVGSYVDKLDQIVESYRLENGFREAQDDVVISMKDDIYGVKGACDRPSNNLLRSANDLVGASLSGDDWELAGCEVRSAVLAETAPETDPDAAPQTIVTDTSAPNCIDVPRDGVEPLFLDAAGSSVSSFRLVFGGGVPCDVPGASPDGWWCGLRPESRIQQVVQLQPGRHVLSWYFAGSESFGHGLGTVSGAVVSEVQTQDGPATVSVGGEQWFRSWVGFEVSEAGPVQVRFGVPVGTAQANIPSELRIAGAMLERAADESTVAPLGDAEPSPVEVADANGNTRAVACQDIDGDQFRRVHWTRSCTKECSDGASSDCRGAQQTRCYREASFHVSQLAWEGGELFRFGGFAFGNYNYRIENLAVNVVGTGLRKCSDSDAPASCFGGGYVPFSIYHRGPFYIRNIFGDDYRAHLFDGVIESARALGSERVLTNPLGPADQELVEQYRRLELQGRPLDGTFVVRLWEDEAFDFDAVEDVQLALKYRYWTPTQ